MQRKHLISVLSAALKAHADDRKSKDILVNHESTLTVQLFQEYLNNIASENADLVTDDEIRTLEKLIADHFYRAANYDGVIVHQPHTSANRICFTLAYTLSPIVKKDLYQILIPSLTIYNNDFTQRKLSDLKPHQFILTDDNTAPIEIAPCLDLMKNGRLEKVCLLDGTIKELTDTERRRIINHSDQVNAYYNRTIEDNELHMSNHKPSNNKRKRVRRKIQADDAQYEVTATYGEAGRAQFKSKLVPNAEALVEALLLYPNRKDWESFLNAFTLQELETLGEFETNPEKGAEFNRAASFVTIYVYNKKLLERTNEFNNPLGRLTGHSKSDKQEKVKPIYQFLISELSFERYKETISPHRSGAMIWNTLNAINKKIEEVSNPAYYEVSNHKKMVA